ncbi:MAG: Adenylate cyclase 2 [Chlamydiae bacterium]|nr:Adenylate cyclase 2 [Chlamydiota bacterium]
MKLRTRLFLWVGIIFFLAFGVSLVFEIYSTDKNLKRAEENLRVQIFSRSEEMRQDIERYLHILLSEDLARVDALLLRMSRDPKLGATLFLDAKDLDLVAPAHSAYLFKNDKWIDFIQTTKNGNLTSLFIPIDFPMEIAHEVPINEKSSWVILEEDREIKRPYIGVNLTASPKEKDLALLIDELVDVDWGLTIFFDPNALIDFEKKAPKGEFDESVIDVVAFEETVAEVAKYLKQTKAKDPSSNWVQKEIQTLSKGKIFEGKPYERGIKCLQEEGELVNNRIIQLLQRGDQAIMISSLASLFPSESFGTSPFAPMAPKGITRFPLDSRIGHTVLTGEIFFKKKAFDDAGYLQSHPPSKACRGIGSSLAIIAPENMNRLFIGNALELEGKTGKGSLSVALDAEEFVEHLVLSSHQSAFLVHDEKVISAFCSDGKRIPNPKTEIPLNAKMLQKKSGIIQWHGEKFYFLHMTPFKNLDLHFFVMQPEKKAFALIQTLDEGSRKVIHDVSFNMRMIAVIALALVLLLLHRVAKQIAQPIADLAKVTQDVVEGKLEGIVLPQVPKGRRDEIATLCTSFAHMVEGLQEKEKVKGVLNKVVSPEIAKEIMKGQVHLGGEERKTTVLFADIRNFTHMTESLKPGEVIELLNTCMTKISRVIDEFGGVIDKYVGDEVMALFGAPLEKENSAVQAIQSALKMVEVLRQWNQEREKSGLQPVEMGIGIHTGVVLAGNMGAENRLNYTVLGSNVNLASRLCSAAKGMEILISQDTLEEPHVKEAIEVEQLPPTELKGFEESYILYRVKTPGGK